MRLPNHSHVICSSTSSNSDHLIKSDWTRPFSRRTCALAIGFFQRKEESPFRERGAAQHIVTSRPVIEATLRSGSIGPAAFLASFQLQPPTFQRSEVPG